MPQQLGECEQDFIKPRTAREPAKEEKISTLNVRDVYERQNSIGVS
jgi:hypothetical protein